MGGRIELGEVTVGRFVCEQQENLGRPLDDEPGVRGAAPLRLRG